jgi:hypothetical protein
MFSSLQRVMGRLGVAALLVLGTSALAQAAVFDGFLVQNSFNTFEDDSREAFFDTGAGNVGTFGVGDVVIGIVQIENRIAPSTTSVNNTTYAIFSQQVTSIVGGTVQFGATTVAGLTMDVLVPGASSSALVSLISTGAGFTTNLITTAPTNQVGGATVTMADYIRFLTNNGTLQITFGIGAGDFFNAALLGAAPTTTAIATSGTSITFANFAAGLSVLQSFLTTTLIDDVQCNGFGTFTLAQLCVSAGAVDGASGVNPANFLDGSEFGAFLQCGTTGGCGFINNADFTVHSAKIPEPASMILFGVGLAALGIYGRRARNRQKAE